MGNTSLISFAFDATDVRATTQDGDPWFVLNDVCKVLEIANPRDAAGRLDDDEKAAVGITDISSNGVEQRREVTIINESGLYSLVLTSRKPEAKRFKKWITSEVIPSIRKTGSYGHTDPVAVLNDPAAMRGLLLSYTEKVLEQQGQIEEMRPQVQALERIALSDGSMCITDAAKTLQVQPKALFGFLRAHRWIYSRGGGESGYIAYQDKLASGLLEHKTTTITKSDGYEKTVTQVRVTAKGLTRLAKEFPPVARAA